MNKNVEHYLENMKKENFRNFLAKLEIEIKTTDDDNLNKKQRYELYKEEIKKKLEEQNLEITTVEQLKKIEQSNSIASFKEEMEQLKNSWREKNKKKVWRGVGITWWFFLLRKLFKKKREKEEEKKEKKRYQKVWKWLGIWAASVWAFFGVKALVWEERWNKFWGTEKNDEEKEDQETSWTHEEINKDLSKEEVEKRNKCITKSIKDSTEYPIKINYWSDKTTLEAKWCPKEIWFDEWSQSILFGDKKLWIKTDEFQKNTSYWKATVTETKFKDIKHKWDKIELTIKAKWKIWIFPKEQEEKVQISKDIFIDILSPYYEKNKTSYNVNIDSGEDNIPLHVKAKS